MAGGPGAKPLIVYCKTCGKRLLVQPGSAGKRGKCAACGSVVYIPFLSESRPPMQLHAQVARQATDTDKTTHLEVIGSPRGLLVGGIVAGVVLLAVVGVAGYSLIWAPPTAAPVTDGELQPLETPALGSTGAHAAAPARPPLPAVGITFVNASDGPLRFDLEHTGRGPRIERTLKAGERITLGLAKGTYKAIWGTFGGGFNFTAGRVEVTQPETWTFTYEPSSAGSAGGWRRRAE
ncbi:MAG: hypothetical protein IMZ66_05610 [Planctomycetes bacterium]|nr:hypothetical protein [Planctomycetota bacterium]